MNAPFQKARKHAELLPFGPAWDGAGVRGFSREGYWYHPLVPGLSFERSTFVAKTVTTYENKGNTPINRFPNSIIPYVRKGMVANAVGLSNPGAPAFLNQEHWFSIDKPFFISYMPILPEADPRAETEVATFGKDLHRALRSNSFASPNVGLQLNISCPNVGADLAHITAKATALLHKLSRLNLPIVVKLNLLVSPEAAAAIAQHPACTGLCIANSIPYGELFPEGWWLAHFPEGSPLQKLGFGNGGLSGAPLLRVVERWLRRFRELDADTYVNAGGGILHPDDVDILHDAGANSIFVSSAAIVRPWRVRNITARAHKIF